MRILVTGSRGFVGNRVFARLTAGGEHTVYGTVHRPEEECAGQRRVLCELSDPESVGRLPRVDAIVHVAARTPFLGSRFEDYFTANCVGTYNLVKWAERTGVQKMIYIGAVSSYGPQKGILSPDSVRVESRIISGDYDLSKTVSDRIVEQSPIDSMTVVLPGVLGEDSHDCWLVRLAADLAENRPVTCYNPENRFNNAVTADAAADFVEVLLNRGRLGGKTVILGASNFMTIREICIWLKERLRSSSEVTYEQKADAGFVLDTGPAVQAGFAPLTMEEMLAVTAEAVRQKRFSRYIS